MRAKIQSDFNRDKVAALIAGLKRRGVSEELLAEALEEAQS